MQQHSSKEHRAVRGAANAPQLTYQTASGRFSLARNCLKQFRAVSGCFGRFRAVSGGFGRKPGTA
eukprot:3490234-Alexandrium_andersonii.AAC.1